MRRCYCSKSAVTGSQQFRAAVSSATRPGFCITRLGPVLSFHVPQQGASVPVPLVGQFRWHSTTQSNRETVKAQKESTDQVLPGQDVGQITGSNPNAARTETTDTSTPPPSEAATPDPSAKVQEETHTSSTTNSEADSTTPQSKPKKEWKLKKLLKEYGLLFVIWYTVLEDTVWLVLTCALHFNWLGDIDAAKLLKMCGVSYDIEGKQFSIFGYELSARLVANGTAAELVIAAATPLFLALALATLPAVRWAVSPMVKRWAARKAARAEAAAARSAAAATPGTSQAAGGAGEAATATVTIVETGTPKP
jgi:hypothetical protein